MISYIVEAKCSLIVSLDTSVRVPISGSTLSLKSMNTHSLKVKVKFNLKPAMKVKGKYRCSSTLSLTSALDRVGS